MNEHTPRPFKYAAAATFVLGLAALGASWVRLPISVNQAFLLLLVSAIVAESAAVLLPRGFSISLSFPLSLAASLLMGPSAGGAIAFFTGVSISDIRDRVAPVVLMYNAGQVVLTTVLSAWLYLLLGGRVLLSSLGDPFPLEREELTELVLPLLALGFSAALINAALTSLGMSLLHGRSGAWAQQIGFFALAQFSLSVVAVSIAQVMSVELAGLLLFVFPLLVARQVYQRYSVLKHAYVDTVQSLIAALEAKDVYTAGHSERVASYSVAIARSMRLQEGVVERIHLAAQLHDLGKVSIPNDVLSKPGRLTHEEFEMIRRHPEVGAELVAKVADLAHLASIVRHHHERFDGDGYCAGLAGEDIPLEARIMAVADSFDAMTSNRAYRSAMSTEAALDELGACAGTQFDPQAVEHFMRTVPDDRNGGAR